VTEPVALEAIRSCFEGVIPSPLATCSADGTPNITYMSIVQYVDSERVALSRQFFNKTRTNLDENALAQVQVIEPATLARYALDLRFLHTETEGPVFEAMKANLEAIASQTGMGDVFRLRGVDIHRVLHCAPAGGEASAAAPRREPQADLLGPLDEFVRRLAACEEYGEATRTALQALDDLFGLHQAILLAGDERGDRLFGVASNGYAASAAGAEVALGVGLIGIAAERRRVVCVPNLARARTMSAAVRESAGRGGATLGPEIALPGLDSAQSAAAVPLVVQGALTGVLYLESDRHGRFGPHDERLLRILGGHVAAALAVLAADREESAPPASPPPPAPPGDALAVSYYQADDSVFVAGEYVIRGVPGRILWRLLNEHAAQGRTAFANRELRLDERLGLPPGNDNLEARLLVLRKRLADAGCGIGLERVARGRLALHVTRPLELSEVATSGPMKAAHEPR
jgi:GAF domain-containing protein/pyridoxamine 5'-phosphate oxidase-like protein